MIFLKDNIILDVQFGVKIFGFFDIEDYVVMIWGYNKDWQFCYFIVGKDVCNIVIIGGGIIDGNGLVFWEDFDLVEDLQWKMAKFLKISLMVEIQDCQDVWIKDVLLFIGGGWILYLYDSDCIQVQGVKIINDLFVLNGDGIDIFGCYDVIISDCIIKICDDVICLKIMVDICDCKCVIVINCVIECFCVVLKIGNEIFWDIKQVIFSNSVIYGFFCVFVIYVESVGIVEDIVVDNIIIDFWALLFYNCFIYLSFYLLEFGVGGCNGDWMYQEKKQYDYEGCKFCLCNVMIINFYVKIGGCIFMIVGDGYVIENLIFCNVNFIYFWIEDLVLYVDEVISL